jgi:hypothetical protein
MHRRYWLRIGFGAAAVFGVGMALILLARRSIAEVKMLAQSTRPISIPMGILPFKVDGVKLGKVSRLELLRSVPNDVSGFRLLVRLQDSAAAGGLKECNLTINDPDSFADHGGFSCEAGDSAKGKLERIGEVVFEPGDMVRAIFAPAGKVAKWRAGHAAAIETAASKLEARGLADSAARLRVIADSVRALVEIGGTGDSALVRIQADSHGARMRVRDRSGREVLRLRADSTGASLLVSGDSASGKR